MFKGKVYLYKNINWVEVKKEKDFNNEDEFNKYVENNPDLKKLNTNFENIDFPKSFSDMRKFFDDFDNNFFWNEEKRKWYFKELSSDFEKMLEKSKKFLGM